jgi:hypothetical protein
VRLAHFDERLGDVAAGVVHQHVEHRHRRDDFPDFGGAQDVAGHRVGLAAGGADLGSGLLDLVPGPCNQPHFRAGLREGDGAGAADAAAGAGDERGAAIEAESVIDGQRQPRGSSKENPVFVKSAAST